MGRKPIGDRAMTDAERQRKRREKLAEEVPLYPEGFSPDWYDNMRNHTDAWKFSTQLCHWLEHAPDSEVANFLAEYLSLRGGHDGIEHLFQMIRDKVAADWGEGENRDGRGSHETPETVTDAAVTKNIVYMSLSMSVKSGRKQRIVVCKCPKCKYRMSAAPEWIDKAWPICSACLTVMDAAVTK